MVGIEILLTQDLHCYKNWVINLRMWIDLMNKE